MTDDVQSDTGDDRCPECGAELEPMIDYVRGHKTSAGWNCPECGYERIF